MAHTNETVNYHLSQFVGTDIPNPLVDYNGDMEKIDTAIKNVADASAGYASDIADLEVQNGSETLTTTAQTLSGAVNELDADFGDVNTRLTTAEGKITADEGTLATAVSNISTLSGKVSAVETKVGSAVLITTASDCSGAINELKNEIDGAGSSLVSRVAALETQNGSEVLQTTAQTLSGAINELYNAPSAGVTAADVSFDGTTSSLSATNVQGAIDEVVSDMEDIPVVHEEAQTATITAGQTSATLTFTTEAIGASTLIVPSASVFGIISDVTYTASTVVITIDEQASDVTVGALVKNF